MSAVIPRDPPRFIGAFGLASIAAGAVATALIGALRVAMPRLEAGSPNPTAMIFGVAATAMYLLLRLQRPDVARRWLYTGPLVSGSMFGPVAGIWLATTAYVRGGDTNALGRDVVTGFWVGLAFGVFMAIPLTPIAVAARHWVRGPFDRALFAASCIVAGAGVPIAIVHSRWVEATWLECYALVLLGACGLFYFAARTLLPRPAVSSPTEGPFRSAPSGDAKPHVLKTPRTRAAIALVFGVALLASLPFAWRARAFRFEHASRFPRPGRDSMIVLGSLKNLAVSRGASACAQRADNTVVCWGENVGPILGASWLHARTPTPREGLGPVDRFAIEADRMCVLPRIGGRVVCWETLDEPLEMGPVGAIDLALDHGTTYALTKDGEVWTWGVSAVLPAMRVEGLPARARVLRVADRRACVIDEHGDVYCWHSSGPRDNGIPEKLELPGPVDRLGVGSQSVVAHTGGDWILWSRAVSAEGPPFVARKIVDDKPMKDVVADIGAICRLYEDGASSCGPSGSGSPFKELPAGSVDELAMSSYLICARGPTRVTCFTQY